MHLRKVSARTDDLKDPDFLRHLEGLGRELDGGERRHYIPLREV